jgi:hypothetical protein
VASFAWLRASWAANQADRLLAVTVAEIMAPPDTRLDQSYSYVQLDTTRKVQNLEYMTLVYGGYAKSIHAVYWHDDVTVMIKQIHRHVRLLLLFASQTLDADETLVLLRAGAVVARHFQLSRRVTKRLVANIKALIVMPGHVELRLLLADEWVGHLSLRQVVGLLPVLQEKWDEVGGAGRSPALFDYLTRLLKKSPQSKAEIAPHLEKLPRQVGPEQDVAVSYL